MAHQSRLHITGHQGFVDPLAQPVAGEFPKGPGKRGLGRDIAALTKPQIRLKFGEACKASMVARVVGWL